MFRPRNETQADLEAEAAALAEICAWLRCDATKLSPMLYALDWVFHREGIPVAWGEFKVRRRRYPTLLVSLGKVMHARALENATGLKAYMFIRWPDGLYYARFPVPIEAQIRMGGNDRGQPGDVEPVVHIPSELFRKIDAKTC